MHEARLGIAVPEEESDIYFEIFTLAEQVGAINLAQGFPDGAPTPRLDITEAALRSQRSRQYAPLYGTAELRSELAARAEARGLSYDPDGEITVTVGCTEAVAAALLAVTPPDSEILALEPFYDNYPGLARLAGARLVPVPLAGSRGSGPLEPDFDALRRAVTPATRTLLLNTPNNPTGFTLSARSAADLAEFAVEHDLLVVSDEVYEEHTYDGPHVCIAAQEGMRERTIVCSSASKMLSLGGWRIGWMYAPRELSVKAQYHHRHLAFSVPAPLQAITASALRWADDSGYFDTLRAEYRVRRNILWRGLTEAGLRPQLPSGGFFVTADAGPWGAGEDIEAFAKDLVATTGVAALPMSDFFPDRRSAGRLLRFAFCKPVPTLREAVQRLAGVPR